MVEKSYGEVKMDYRGRFVLPAKLRNVSGFQEAIFEVLADTDTNRITLVKKRDVIKPHVCLICGSSETMLKELNSKYICIDCYNKL